MSYLIKHLYWSSCRYVFYLSEGIVLWTFTIIGNVFRILFNRDPSSQSRLKSSQEVGITSRNQRIVRLNSSSSGNNSNNDGEKGLEGQEQEEKEEDEIFNGIMQDDDYMQDEDQFSPQRCRTWFQSYVISSPNSNEMNEDDVIRFCSEIDKSLEDIVHLVLAYKMGAKRVGFFTRKEWLRGMSELGIDSRVKLLEKWECLRTLLDDKTFLRKVYRFSFKFSRTSERRNLEMDLCQGLIKIFFENRWPFVYDFIKFLDTVKHRGMTQDEFCSVYEFQDSFCDDDLSNYDFEGAWPILLDDFVTHMKQKAESSD